jgi:hypothetical protein
MLDCKGYILRILLKILISKESYAKSPYLYPIFFIFVSRKILAKFLAIIFREKKSENIRHKLK